MALPPKNEDCSFPEATVLDLACQPFLSSKVIRKNCCFELLSMPSLNNALLVSLSSRIMGVFSFHLTLPLKRFTLSEAALFSHPFSPKRSSGFSFESHSRRRGSRNVKNQQVVAGRERETRRAYSPRRPSPIRHQFRTGHVAGSLRCQKH